MGNTFTRKKKKVKFKLSSEQIKEYITDDGVIDMNKLRNEYDEKSENKKKTNIETKVKKDKPKIISDTIPKFIQDHKGTWIKKPEWSDN